MIFQPCLVEDADLDDGAVLSRVGDDSSSRPAEICDGDSDIGPCREA